MLSNYWKYLKKFPLLSDLLDASWPRNAISRRLVRSNVSATLFNKLCQLLQICLHVVGSKWFSIDVPVPSLLFCLYWFYERIAHDHYTLRDPVKYHFYQQHASSHWSHCLWTHLHSCHYLYWSGNMESKRLHPFQLSSPTSCKY